MGGLLKPALLSSFLLPLTYNLLVMSKKKPRKKLGVFIPVGNDYAFLQLLVGSIASKSHELEVFLLCNSPNEDSQKICKILGRRKGIQARFIPKELSRSEALNALLHWAVEESLDTAVLCTASAILHNSCIDTLVGQLEKNPNELVACAVDAKRIVEVINQFPFLRPEEIQKLVPKKDPIHELKEALDTIQLASDNPFPTYGLIDYGCIAVRVRTLIETVGLFDEQFTGRYWEDLDLHWRLAELDIKTASVINALYLNTKVEDTADEEIANRFFIPNGFYFVKKHGLVFRPEQLVKDATGNLKTIKQFDPQEAFTVYENELERRIYDCVVVEEDLDVLELRIKLLYPYVDFFVVAEAPLTLEGKPKPLFLKEQKDRFAPYAKKIRKLVLPDFKKATTPDERRSVLTRALSAGLKDARHTDLVMVSRANQIPNMRKVREFMRMPNVKLFSHLKMLDHLNVSDGSRTDGTRVTTFKSVIEDFGGDLSLLAQVGGFKVAEGGIALMPFESKDLKPSHKFELDYRNMHALPDEVCSDKRWTFKFTTHKGVSFVDATLELYDN